MISKYSALIFDMDGTLIDSMGYWRRQNLEFLRARGLPVPEPMRGHELEYTGRQAAELYIKLGLPMTVEQIFAECEQAMLVNYQSVTPEKPGALNFLQTAHRKGYRMCVATATPTKNAVLALDRLGMTPYLSFVTSIGDVGVDKREPEFFKRVCQRLALPGESCLVFEDALYAMKAAKRAGCDVYAIEERTAQADRREIEMVSDKVFRSFDQLLGEL